MSIIHEIKIKLCQYWDIVCFMHNLAAVFDPRIKLSGVHILLDEIGRYMNEDSNISKAEVTTLLNDIFTICDEKIRGSRILTFS